MRQFMIGILCTAAHFSASCSKSPEGEAPEAVNAGGAEQANAAAEEYYTVRAGPVANAKINALSGDFQVLKVSAAQGIVSDRRGGACLIFRPEDLGFSKMAAKSCTSNKDCYTGEGESAGYCDLGAHQWWAKPSTFDAANALCNKGKIFDAGTVNSVPADPPGPGPIDVSKWVKPGAKVRVVACIGKPWNPPPPPAPPCGQVDTADRVEVMGPAATVKP